MSDRNAFLVAANQPNRFKWLVEEAETKAADVVRVEDLSAGTVTQPYLVIGVEESAPWSGHGALARLIQAQPDMLDNRKQVVVALNTQPGKLLLKDRVRLMRMFPDPERVHVCEGRSETRVIISNLSARSKVLLAYKNARAGSLRARGGENRAPVGARALTGVIAQSGSRGSALDSMRIMIEVSKDLRAESGRLSAKAVAGAFGVSLRKLAGWLGAEYPTVHKTPDALTLQPALGFFERTARLRTALEDNASFQKWLNMANPQLDGQTPLGLLSDGRGQIIADFVDDILTGAPS